MLRCWRPPRSREMLRNVKRMACRARFLVLASMSDPSSAVIAKMKAAFALPGFKQMAEVEQSPESLEFSESDWAVALFEHPGH